MHHFFGCGAGLVILAGLLFVGMCAHAADKPQYPPRRAPLPVPFGTQARTPERGCTVERETVGVELLEELGVPRKGVPVTLGFPFPKGVLFDPQRVRLLSPGGEEVPAQFTVTCPWPDGSIKWMLVDFLADLQPKERPEYRMEYGAQVRRSPYKTSLLLEETEDKIVVSTGPLRVGIGKKRFALFDSVCMDMNGDGRAGEDEALAGSVGGGLVLVGDKDEVYTSADGGPVDVRVEESGPVKLTVRFEGAYGDKSGKKYFRHVTRIQFFAESAAVRVIHTHIDDQTQKEFSDFRSLEMPVALKRGGGAGADFLLFDEKEGPCLKAGARLLQKDDGSFELSGAAPVAGRRAPGMADYVGPQGHGVAVGVEDFWRLFPKGLNATSEALTVELCPRLDGQDFYKSLPDYVGFFMVDGKHRFKMGMAKTHRITFLFHGPSQDPLAQARALTEPVVAVLPNSWHFRTGALGLIAPKEGTEFNAYDEAFERAFRGHMERKEKEREYGLLNWGDWYGERGRNWGNNEYDLPHALFMQFARTGDRDYFRMALAGARHMGDVDCVHACAEPERVGAMHLHAVDHTGTWSEKDKDPSWSGKYGWETWGANGHTWSEGMVDAWWLTGDARVMECAQALGDHFAYGVAPTFTDLGTHERSGGWALVAIMAIYRATYDPVYLDAARKIAEVALRSQKDDPRGLWPHPLPGYHCGHPPEHRPRCVGNMTWLLGILGAGLAAYQQETGDERTMQCLEKLSSWLVTQWVPADNNFTQSTCTFYSGKGTGHPGLTLVPICHVWARTREPKLLDIMARGFLTDIADVGSSFGKSFAQATRWAPTIMGSLHDAKEKTPAVAEAMSGSFMELQMLGLGRALPMTEMRLRAPTLKVIYLLNEAGGPFKLTAVRTPYGAMPKQAPTGTIALFDPDNRRVNEEGYSTDEARTVSFESAQASKGIYRLEIADDMRAIWDVKSTLPKMVIAMKPVGSIAGGRGRGGRRCYFFVPQGTREFKVGFSAGHTGMYAGAVQAPDGSMAGSTSFVHPDPKAHEPAWIVVRPEEGQTGNIWSFIFAGPGDISVWVEGAPPFYALGPDALFVPEGR